MLVSDTFMSDNGTMAADKPDKGLDALEADLAAADPANAPEIAEELATLMSEELDQTAGGAKPTDERPS